MTTIHSASVGGARLQADELLSGTADAVVVVDAGVVSYASPGLADVLGYPSGAIDGSRLLDLVTPADHARATKILAVSAGFAAARSHS